MATPGTFAHPERQYRHFALAAQARALFEVLLRGVSALVMAEAAATRIISTSSTSASVLVTMRLFTVLTRLVYSHGRLVVEATIHCVSCWFPCGCAAPR